MKFFVILVIALIGLGVSLRFKNDVTLSETAIEEEEVEVVQPRIRPRPQKRSLYLPPQDPASTPGDANTASTTSETSSTYSSNTSEYDEFLPPCPYIDAEGNCIAEPEQNEVANESYQDDESLTMESARNVEEFRKAEENEYNRYLNEQTFDSLRTPASDE